MLGIRKFRNIAIDLWVGPWEGFACDGQLFLPASSQQLAQALLQSGRRHLALIPTASENDNATAHQQLAELQQVLASLAAPPSLRRVSVLLSNVPRYRQYQSILFSLFPEQ